MRTRTVTSCTLTFLLLSGAAGCAPEGADATGQGGRSSGQGGAADQPAGLDGAQSPAEAWRLEDVRFDASDGISVLVLHDMEGLSGQDDWRTFDHEMPQYARGQELLAADVNAVVEGLFAGGATEVHVVDGHGSGNPEPDVRGDLLDARARQVFRDEPFDTYFDLPETSSYDAVAVVGMHSKTGSGGFAAHTFTLGIELRINGQPITETELVALSWGRAGVPVIFGSGDDRLAADLQTMPWIEFVTVKRATSASTAEPLQVEDARAALTEGARRAVENLASARVIKVSTPIRATLRAVPPANLTMLEGVPGLDYERGADDRGAVSFTTDDLRAAYDGLTALVGVATGGYTSVLREVLRTHPAGDSLIFAYGVAVMERWLDVESDRWQPDAEPTAAVPARHHGYR